MKNVPKEIRSTTRKAREKEQFPQVLIKLYNLMINVPHNFLDTNSELKFFSICLYCIKPECYKTIRFIIYIEVHSKIGSGDKNNLENKKS